MAMNRGQFSPLLSEGLREVFFQHLRPKEWVYPKIFEIKGSKKKSETDETVASLGMLSEKAEGEPLTFDDFILGYEKVYTHTTFAKGMRMTAELMEDDLYSVMSKRVKALARSAAYRKEFDHASVFNNAFSSSYTGGDSVSLCNASHPRADGGTVISNTAGAYDLSVSTLETAFTAFRRMKDDRGLLVGVKPKVLLIPPEYEFDAMEILDSTGKPYTADNEINPYRGRLEIVVWDFLTDTDAWFILADKADMAPMSFNRVATQFDTDTDFMTKDLLASARTRYSYGFSDWRWCYGGSG